MKDLLKQLLQSRFPSAGSSWRKCRRKLRLLGKDSVGIFSEIYAENKWGSNETASGPGSNLERTAKVRAALPPLLKELNCQSLLDIPCGDFYWMSTLRLQINYIGADIVAEMIRINRESYGNPYRTFVVLDIVNSPLPYTDLVLSRDCFVHLSNQDVLKALNNLKMSGAKYLLTTTFPQRKQNHNILTGEWRPLNLQRSPFNLPQPAMLIDETFPLPDYFDKYLGLWRLSEI